MAAPLGFKTFTVGEVLSAADVNGYLMQGVLVFATTAARDAAITSPQEGQFAFTKDTNSLFYYDGAAWVASGATGDIEGVTAGVGISGGGTSGTVTVTNSMATAIDAKGDLVVGTGADTFSRLAVGTNTYTLVADSSEATGLKWAAPSSGAMTLLSTTSLTGSTVDISSIDQTYTDLVAVISDVYMDNDTGTFSVRFNTISTGNYTFNTTKCNSTYATLNFGHSETAYDISGKTDETTGRFKLAGMITMPRYASATNKFATHQTLSSPDGSAANVNFGVCNFQTTSGISTITFRLSAGTFSGGTVYLYGVK